MEKREMSARREADKALRESEDKYRAFFERDSDAIFIFDPDTNNILDANKATSEIYGYDKDELIGMSCLKLSAEVEKSTSAIGRIREKGDVNIQYRSHRKKDGTVFHVDLSVYKTKLGNKNVMFAVVKDVTEYKAMQVKLQESEEFIRAVLDNLPIGVAVNSVNPVVEFSYMNDNFPKFYRTTKKALANPDAFWDTVYEDPEFRKDIMKRVLDDCATGDPDRMYWEDVPITRKGEAMAYISARNIPIPGKYLMMSTVWDVTERKMAEDEIESISRFPSENPNPVIRIDNTYRILYRNDAFNELLNGEGLSEEDSFVILPDNMEALVDQALNTEQAIQYIEVTVGDKIISYNIIPIVEKEYVNLYGRDITDKNKALDELKARTEEVERVNRAFVGRELKMVALKKEIEELKKNK